MSPIQQVFARAEELGRKNPSNHALKAFITAYPSTVAAADVSLAGFEAYLATFGSPYVP